MIKIQQQDETCISATDTYVEIEQQDRNGEISKIYIAQCNIDRFIAAIQECADKAIKNPNGVDWLVKPVNLKGGLKVVLDPEKEGEE